MINRKNLISIISGIIVSFILFLLLFVFKIECNSQKPKIENNEYVTERDMNTVCSKIEVIEKEINNLKSLRNNNIKDYNISLDSNIYNLLNKKMSLDSIEIKLQLLTERVAVVENDKSVMEKLVIISVLLFLVINAFFMMMYNIRQIKLIKYTMNKKHENK